DVNIKDLTTPEQDKFEASVKGAYNFLTEKTEISQGNLMSSDGGKISFKGVIDKEKFNLDFETKNMSVEEFLKLLPTELKEKYNLGIDRGSAKLKDFKIEIEKKNLNLMVSSPLIFPKLPFLTYNCIT
ncbi:MAG: hypothetical protein RBT05_10755, partial [Bacteroidales bacterium]|nr:hypothetical protein [Bacteroidales bacterium]